MSNQPHPNSWLGRGGTVKELENVLVRQMVEFIDSNQHLKFAQRVKEMGVAIGGENETVIKSLIMEGNTLSAQQMILNILKSEANEE